MVDNPILKRHSSHWGAFRAKMTDQGLQVLPFEQDPDPSPLLGNIPTAVAHPARLRKPLVRRGWLQDGPGPDGRRGQDDYVEMEWDDALGLAASELARLGAASDLPQDGPLPGAQVFGGSYGWSSAGRFHHAQGLVHRFLNSVFGGYVASVDTYSSAAGAVILDLVWGNPLRINRDFDQWSDIRDKTELLIAFGGMPRRNLAISPGGNSQHIARDTLAQASARGCEFVSLSPIADDIDDLPNLTRIALRPATDVAFMLGMAWHLHSTGQVNQAYLDRYTSGYPAFLRYLTGEVDSQPKTPDWASGICGVAASEIAGLADRAARKRTLISTSYALQRAENGEQPIWMALTLAAMLGQYTQPGAGFCYGLSSLGNVGKPPAAVPLPTMPQGENRVADFIPVARISELLLNPGKTFTYKGETRTYADIRLVYWAGGNTFHHHQDLTRLQAAFSRPDTIIVHDSVGTATARHADIVFPATISAERDDIGAGGNDNFLMPMQRLVPPMEGPRDDFDIFKGLASRVGCEHAFTEGRSPKDWQRQIYDVTRAALVGKGLDAPDFDSFMAGAFVELPPVDTPGAVQRFHQDPTAHPLQTRSGKIEIFSDIVAGTGLPGHPAWLEPDEWLGADLAQNHPFQLVANQPARRLHSQLDFGAHSMAGKRDGREVARINRGDADRLGVDNNDIVRVWNDRGATLAAVELSDAIRPSVVQLSTGAWYAPVDLPGSGRTCVNGNPNAVTHDKGASRLSQGCAGQLCLVSVEKWTGPVPPTVPHDKILNRDA